MAMEGKTLITHGQTAKTEYIISRRATADHKTQDKGWRPKVVQKTRSHFIEIGVG